MATIRRSNTRSAVAIGAFFPDIDPVAQRLDRVATVGQGVKTAVLILAGTLVVHTFVLIVTRPSGKT